MYVEQASTWAASTDTCSNVMAPKQRTNPRLRPIGVVRSVLKARGKAPRQGFEGAPDAWIDLEPRVSTAVEGLAVGDEILVLTWFHQAERRVLQVHPRDELRNPLTGVFATRSSDRPNPIGLHPVTIRSISRTRLRVGPLEAIDGTPVVDIKPVLTPPPRKQSRRRLPKPAS